MAPAEQPKRLALSRDTVRELYLKSGNRCAFPGCHRLLFTAEGRFVGQICHIEAAEQGGERFNPNQTNDERRSAANLLLMCYEHHVSTDDVERFPVERMKQIKEEHEKKFSDVVGTMLDKVVDHTTLTDPVKATTLTTMNRVLGWKLTPEDLVPMVAEMAELAVRLATIPIPARELFSVIARRAACKKGGMGVDLEVPWPEIQQATRLTGVELRDLLSTLDRYGFVSVADYDDLEIPTIQVPLPRSGWPVWSDIRQFCDSEGVSPSQIIVNLDFAVLD